MAKETEKLQTKEEKIKALEQIIASIEKQHYYSQI